MQIKNKFDQIFYRKRELYKKILLNKENNEIEEFKNNKFFLQYMQKKN